MAAKALLQTLRHVWQTTERLGCRPILMGGLAVSAWGHIRATHDVDLLVGLGNEDVPHFLDELQKAKFRLKTPATPVLDLRSVRVVQLMYEPPGVFMELQVDLILAESEYHHQAVARSKTIQLPDLDFDLAVLSCEDLIIFKLNAGRIIDRSDLRILLRLNRPNLDFEYLTTWVAKLTLDQLWAEIWQEAFPGEAVRPAEPSPAKPQAASAHMVNPIGTRPR